MAKSDIKIVQSTNKQVPLAHREVADDSAKAGRKLTREESIQRMYAKWGQAFENLAK